ncbi:MAG: hypothetical protein QF890_17030 [Myxococcota bacterium]|nr:hypothetical protein [Myxococcota bacterium]
MKSPAAALPTPEQSAETPERVTLSGLDHAIELTIPALIGLCPGLDDAAAPYWVIEPSKAQPEAHHLVTVAHHLRQ